jgi:hypothetical protein
VADHAWVGREEGHFPIPCDVAKWHMKNYGHQYAPKDLEATFDWLMVRTLSLCVPATQFSRTSLPRPASQNNTKDCPKCGKPIQKDGATREHSTHARNTPHATPTQHLIINSTYSPTCTTLTRTAARFQEGATT